MELIIYKCRLFEAAEDHRQECREMQERRGGQALEMVQTCSSSG